MALPAPPPPFGWLVLRHVASGEHVSAQFWHENARRLRRWFPSDPILIIDNRSNRTVFPLTWRCPEELAPCSVVFHDDDASAEMLPYYIMATRQPFRRAVFLFDSTFALSPKDDHAPAERMARARATLTTGETRPLWGFDTRGHFSERHFKWLSTTTMRLLNALNHSRVLRARALDYSSWWGCFGAMAVFDVEFATMLFRDLGFERLRKLLTNRIERMAFERIMGIVLSFGGFSPAEQPHKRTASPTKRAVQGDIVDAHPHKIECAPVLRDEFRSRTWSSNRTDKSTQDVFLNKCWALR